jgi:hypothetical protein
MKKYVFSISKIQHPNTYSKRIWILFNIQTHFHYLEIHKQIQNTIHIWNIQYPNAPLTWLRAKAKGRVAANSKTQKKIITPNAFS